MKKSFISSLLIGCITLGITFTSIPSYIVFADSFKSVTLGADLSETQKNEMLKYFDVQGNDANILDITSNEEYEALGDILTSTQLGSKAISCSYVEPTANGGLQISTYNLTWVTEGMIKNALITAGIDNANVVAAAPFKVSGTAALTGILKGFEKSSSGKVIDEDKKEAANEEIVTTGNLADKIGQDDATNLINDIKTKVVKENPSDKELEKIISKEIKEYKGSLSEEDIAQINALMKKINNLDLNYDDIKSQLKDISNELKDKLGSEEAKGFFAKIGSFFSGLWTSITDFFTSEEDVDKDAPIDTETPSTDIQNDTNTNSDNDLNNKSTSTVD